MDWKKTLQHFPWFLCVWTIVLIYNFISQNLMFFVYDCQHSIFNMKLLIHHTYHNDIEHLVFNLGMFWMFGLYITFTYDDFVNCVIYTLGAIVSGCIYYLKCIVTDSDHGVIGASGGICAMIGAVFVFATTSINETMCEINQDYPLRIKLAYSIKKNKVSFIMAFGVLGMVCVDVTNSLMLGDTNVSYTSHFTGYATGLFLSCAIKKIIK